jgi:hypothetical protein
MPDLKWQVVIAYVVTIAAAAFLVHSGKVSFEAIVAVVAALFAPSPVLRTGDK